MNFKTKIDILNLIKIKNLKFLKKKALYIGPWCKTIQIFLISDTINVYSIDIDKLKI